MGKYTFIMYFRGGTYISQVEENNLTGSIKLWASKLDIKPIKYFGIKAKEDLLKEIDEEIPTLLDGLSNIWYMGFLLNGSYTVVHVIRTDKNSEDNDSTDL